jgi:hypothetical protein
VCSSNKATWGHGNHKRMVITVKETSMAIRITRIPATPIIHNTLRMVEAGPVATVLQTLRTISGKAANMGIRITPIRIRKAEPTMICGSTTRVRRMRSEKQAGVTIYQPTYHVNHGMRNNMSSWPCSVQYLFFP